MKKLFFLTFFRKCTNFVPFFCFFLEEYAVDRNKMLILSFFKNFVSTGSHDHSSLDMCDDDDMDMDLNADNDLDLDPDDHDQDIL